MAPFTHQLNKIIFQTVELVALIIIFHDFFANIQTNYTNSLTSG